MKEVLLKDFKKQDVDSIVGYIKKTKTTFKLKLPDIALCSDLCDALRENRIGYTFYEKTLSFVFNESVKIRKEIISIFVDSTLLSRLRIKSVKIRYLFGYIKYDLKMKDNLLVVHAPNGYGKSTLIKCIKYFAEKNYNSLFKLPFYEATIQLQDDLDAGSKIYTFTFLNDKDKHYMYRMVNDDLPQLFTEYIPGAYDRKMYYTDKVVDIKKIHSNNLMIIHNYNDERTNLERIADSNIIAQNRNTENYYSSGNERIDLIDLYNEIMKDFFGEEKVVYLDKKLVKTTHINNKFREYDEKRINLKDALVIKNNVEPLKEANCILKYNEIIPYEVLSDGEKYIINLFYDIIFPDEYDMSKTYLYIIDEPELNLHVEWQHLLIKHVKRLVELSKFYDPIMGDETISYIITTHSPYIVNYPEVEVGNPEYESE